MYPEAGARYRFGVFDFDTSALELHKSGRIVRIRPQSLKLLTLLLARAGDVVTRDEIQQAVWGNDTFVDFEQGVNHCINELRRAVGDTAESPRFIQTLPRRGYRFIAPVERIAAEPLAALPAAPSPIATQPPIATHPIAVPARRGLSRLSLTAMVLTAALAAVVITFASFAAGSRSVATPLGSTLTVRPFSTPQSDPSIGVGLANAISARLAGQQVVFVQPMYRDDDASDGAAQRATLTLDGEIVSSGSTVTVLARLEEQVSGATVWTDRYTVHADELFSVEDVIAERVVAALNLRLAASEQDRLRRRYTKDAAAYQDYLRGRAAVVKYTPEATRQAIEAFEGALRRDPTYALARAGLAMACADMYLRFAPAAEVEAWGKRAEAEARAALDLDHDLAEAHLARAAVARKREFDWNAAMAASRRALVLNPNLDQARFFMAAAYYHLGFMEEALIELEKGRALRGADRVEPVRIEALVALFSGNFVPARVHLEEVSRSSSQTIGDTYLALAYYYSGHVERARTMLESLSHHASASTATRSSAALAGVLAAQGESAAARKRVAEVLARDYRDHHVAYSLGVAYGQLGEIEQAVHWLRTAADTGFPCLTWFERDPLLQPVRSSREFPSLQAHVRERREWSLVKVD